MSNLLTSGLNMGGQSSFVTMLIVYVLLFGGLYFFLLRPSQKRTKREEAMRNNLQIGDDVTTIGGIVGKVISIKEGEDTIVIETGVDRSKLCIRKWGIASCDTKKTEESK